MYTSTPEQLHSAVSFAPSTSSLPRTLRGDVHDDEPAPEMERGEVCLGGRALASEHPLELDADRGFVTLLRLCKPHGGLGRGDEVAERFVDCGHDLSLLARWIVERRVLCVEWRSELWLPWCQFQPGTMTLKPAVQGVLAELGKVFDAWQLSRWFAEPNAWLGDRAPMALIDSAPDEVLGAARADRFVALG
jgi:hypothetical protein